MSDRLFEALPEAPTVGEAGAGTGTTVPWLLERGVTAGSYRGIDLSPTVVAHAQSTQPAVLRRRGYDAVDHETGGAVETFWFEFEVGDALQLLNDQTYDVVIAQQFMDLVSLEPAVDALTAAVKDGGLVYCPLTFDGVTLFQPDHPADDEVQRAYHEAIDSSADRDARAGRHLIDEFSGRAGSLLAVDASDAVVHPRNGEYPDDERYFLNCLLEFVEESVSVETVREVKDWLSARRDQLADGCLSYVGHRYDFLYRTGAK
ncbi:class I SAM-dependent methyltransferase [Halorubrum sp. BOL3-1]|uniref:class I SAM-dependent methyltransferase n=1 Tax=Halorubrum sp. BOL3-1 TaxID=2497325 RepID=UPI001F4F3395|nr:class I SAM-dependent methyltransferase [Halorubrum sp. BOL3-1]